MDDMPVWYHRFSGGDRRLFNTNKHTVKCMKEKHKIHFVRDARELSRKAGAPRHTYRIDCQCAACQITREIMKCTHPHLCYAKARELLDSLQNKWDPRGMQPEDYEEYQAPGAREEDPPLEEGEEAPVQFDSRVTTKGTLADVFRIFTEGNETQSHTAPLVMFTYVNHGPRTDVYTDGSAIDNDTDNVKAGAGVYFRDSDPRNRSIRVPDEM
jgi:hypothetical protein